MTVKLVYHVIVQTVFDVNKHVECINNNPL